MEPVTYGWVRDVALEPGCEIAIYRQVCSPYTLESLLQKCSDASVKMNPTEEKVCMEASSSEQTCKLCLECKSLCDSHIIPHHFFRKRNNGSGMFELIDGDPIKKRLMKGWTEKLLCRDCETLLERFDNYAAKFFTANNWNSVTLGKYRIHLVHDYNYKLLKLFLLSLLWRAAVASIPAFRAVSFSEIYQEDLRKMLLVGDPGAENDFASVLFKIESHKNGYEKITFSPHRIRHSGCVTYFQLQLNEFVCRIKVSNQSDKQRYEPLWLTETGPLRIMEVPLVQKRLNEMIRIVQTQPKLLLAHRQELEAQRMKR